MTESWTSPLDRRADPLSTPAMTEADLDEVWSWVGLMGTSESDYTTVVGVASLLREIDRARAAEKAAKASIVEVVQRYADQCTERDAAARQLHKIYSPEVGQ